MARASKPAEPAAKLGDDPARLVLVEDSATPAEILYARVAPVVNRLVWVYLATDPERDDIAQDIFVSIVRGAASLRDDARLEGWAARVAINTIWNAFRRRRFRRWLSLESLKGREPLRHHADFEGRELLVRTQRILDLLPPAERMPLQLQLLGNESLEEIARLCDCSARTIKRRLRSARARFARLAGRDPALAGRIADPKTVDGGSDE